MVLPMQRPTTRPRLVVPGLFPADPDVERYRVRPGGLTAIELSAGDELVVIDRYGRQRAELTAVADGGADGWSALGVSADAPATVLRGLASAADNAARSIVASLVARGLETERAEAAGLFGEWSPAGASATFTANGLVTCVVAAPGGKMLVDEQNPPSDVIIEVRRASPRPAVEPVLPAPLADPSLDLRIDKATARSYEVKAGDYIQIIDVEGRQCSDFLAFDGRRLVDGVERGLDATTTRNLMGSAYPQPGLYGKFYDQDMQPLVEVVRDTVGRHDTFALACNAKYYEDMGYPGHVNCTDNFNGQLTSYGVAPRRGWPALNFFYNTFFDGSNQLYFDEPWSRPGDYVLLRAMTDLVCASSACPDDVDPANAWIPTDIHVRVYPAERTFSMAIAHRVTPDAEPQLTKPTGFHPRITELTKQLTEYRGYWLPSRFDNHGALDEYWACRERAAVMDLSPLRKFEVLGPDAEALLQATVTRNMRKLAVGQVVYTAVCNETGGMLDDATVFRLGQDNFRFVGGEAYDGVWLREQAEKLDLDRLFATCTTSRCRGRSAGNCSTRSSGRRRRSRTSSTSPGSGSRSAASVTTMDCRCSSRERGTPGSSATSCGATRAMARPCGTLFGKPVSPTGWRRWGSMHWTSCGSRPV